MKVIWKFPLKLDSLQLIEAPQDFRPLSVQLQDDKICLWGLVSPALTRAPFRVRIYGTGHPTIDDPRRFVGTVQQNGLVWHVFCE